MNWIDPRVLARRWIGAHIGENRVGGGAQLTDRAALKSSAASRFLPRCWSSTRQAPGDLGRVVRRRDEA
jgi:hypothetical protein